MIARYIPTKEALYGIAFVLSFLFLLAIYNAVLRFIPIFQDEQGRLNIVGNIASLILSIISIISFLNILT